MPVKNAPALRIARPRRTLAPTCCSIPRAGLLGWPGRILLALSLVGEPLAHASSPTPAPAPEPAPISTPSEPAPPPTAPSPGVARADQARHAYIQRDFVRSARLYESLFADTRAVKFLYNAGMAREAAGHDAQALLHWREYLRLAGTIDAGERSQLLGQMAAARRRTAPIRLRVASPRTEAVELRYTADPDRDPLRVTVQGRQDLDLEPGTWTATLIGSPRPPVQFSTTVSDHVEPQEIYLRPDDRVKPASKPVTVHFEPPAAVSAGISVSLSGPQVIAEQTIHTSDSTWNLAPEPWTLRARARGFHPVELDLGPAPPPTIDVTLRRDRTRSVNLGLGLGLAVASAGLLAAGTTLAVRGRNDYRTLASEFPADEELSGSDAAALTRSIGHQTAGFGLLGAGVGASVVTITHAARGGRTAFIAEASIGAALLLAGAIGLPLTVASYARGEPSLADADSRRLRDHAFGTTLGLGLGLTSSAVVALITRIVLTRSTERRRMSERRLQWTPHASSLGLQGRF